MSTGHEAARAKGANDYSDAPSRQPMRATHKGEIRRNPSTDQKRARRANQRKVAEWVPGHVECQNCGVHAHPTLGDGTAPSCSVCGSYNIKSTHPGYGPETSRYLHQGDYGRSAAKQATVLNTQAWQLNPGDAIRMPNGRTQKVTRVRPHETSMGHVYVDTDGGTALAKREDAFQVVPMNSQQQSLPGYGVPGGNSNTLPGDPQSGGSNTAPSSSCPVCGRGNLVRQGDHYVCSRCGYKEQFGGAGGKAFSDSPSQVVRTSTFHTVNGTTMSAVARRAAALLNQEESQ